MNRQTLREILLHGLDDIVLFGKTCVGFGPGEGGRVRALFSDGTSVSGDLLVAADGTDSVCRALIAPDAKLTDTGTRAIYGKTKLGTEPPSWMPEVLLTGFTRYAGPGDVTMITVPYRKRTVFETATAELALALPLTETPDYLMGAVIAPLAQLPLSKKHLRWAGRAALHTLASKLIAEWHPSVKRVVFEADEETTFPVAFRCCEPTKRWQTTHATLLGDAIHTSPPTRGVGASTALRDAEILRSTLVSVTITGRSFGESHVYSYYASGRCGVIWFEDEWFFS